MTGYSPGTVVHNRRCRGDGAMAGNTPLRIAERNNTSVARTVCERWTTLVCRWDRRPPCRQAPSDRRGPAPCTQTINSFATASCSRSGSMSAGRHSEAAGGAPVHRPGCGTARPAAPVQAGGARAASPHTPRAASAPAAATGVGSGVPGTRRPAARGGGAGLRERPGPAGGPRREAAGHDRQRNRTTLSGQAPSRRRGSAHMVVARLGGGAPKWFACQPDTRNEPR
jgi:hypothetical protein